MNLSADAILTLAGYAMKYGPEAYAALSALLKKKDPTLEEADALFLNLKPYDAFGIPDVAPTAPVTAIETPVAVTEPAPVVTEPTPAAPASPS